MSNLLQRQYSHTEMAWFYGRIWLSGAVIGALGGAASAANVGGVAVLMLAATALVYGVVSGLFTVIHTLGAMKKDGSSETLKRVTILIPVAVVLALTGTYLLSISNP